MKKYRHFKGDIYKVICESHCEADPDNQDKIIVCYQKADGTGRVWHRASSEFYGYIVMLTGKLRRFTPIQEEDECDGCSIARAWRFKYCNECGMALGR